MLEGLGCCCRRVGWQIGHSHLFEGDRREFENLGATEFLLAIHMLEIFANWCLITLISSANLAARIARHAARRQGNAPFGLGQQVRAFAIERGTRRANLGAGRIMTVLVTMTT